MLRNEAAPGRRGPKRRRAALQGGRDPHGVAIHTENVIAAARAVGEVVADCLRLCRQSVKELL
jgi:hypothetical protein